MSMDEVLGVLTSKAVTEAEEAQRALLGALNGLAALLVIQSDVPGAVRGMWLGVGGRWQPATMLGFGLHSSPLQTVCPICYICCS